MVYLDYSATTKVNDNVLKKFNEVVNNNYANSNSKYSLAKNSLDLINESTKIISDFFNVLPKEIIYTSGATESNNLAIKGSVENRPNTQIITTKLEHPSVDNILGYLKTKGYKISYVEIDNNGLVKLDHLDKLLNETETSLVTICYVNSEVGITQNINEIGLLIKKHNDVLFHSDITQAVGKINIDLTNVDLASFSGHKFYTFKGIGGLIKKSNINLVPQIHGSRSLSNYRSGTPQTELIASLAFSIEEIDLNSYDYVKSLNDKIKKHLSKYNNIVFNSNDYSIPHIINLSVLNKYSDETQDYFNKHNIYISTKSACSSYMTYSHIIYELTNNKDLAESSIRISLSKYTTGSEVDEFLSVFYNYLNN